MASIRQLLERRVIGKRWGTHVDIKYSLLNYHASLLIARMFHCGHHSPESQFWYSTADNLLWHEWFQFWYHIGKLIKTLLNVLLTYYCVLWWLLNIKYPVFRDKHSTLQLRVHYLWWLLLQIGPSYSVELEVPKYRSNVHLFSSELIVSWY